MSGYPAFGVLLARLSGHRGLDAGNLSVLAEIPEPELQAVFKGASPSLPLLTKLSPALGLQVADLLVIAGLPVPEELAPLDPRAGSLVPKLAGQAVCLPAGAREQLLEYARSLPQHDRTQPVPVPKSYEQYPPGFGALLMRMLSTRNLNWWQSAETFARLTGGQLYLSAATVGALGHDVNRLTPGLLAGFALVLGIPVGDLMALGDIRLPDDGVPAYSVPADMAVLIWEVRRLTAEQVRGVLDEASSMSPEGR